jgi:transcriptional regulator with XRE-family HTH domain
MSTIIDYSNIGLRLKEIRENIESKKISQETFGKQFDVSQGYVTKVEKGSKPSLEYILAIAVHYNISLDWMLLGRELANNKNDDILAHIINETAQVSPYIKEWVDLLHTIPFDAQPLLIGTVRTIIQSSYPTAPNKPNQSQSTLTNTENEDAATKAADIA